MVVESGAAVRRLCGVLKAGTVTGLVRVNLRTDETEGFSGKGPKK